MVITHGGHGKPSRGYFHLADKTFPRVKWWKDQNMRLLYFYILALILTNTANGFDGSIMNGLQSINYWQKYFNHPKGGLLGLFGCVMSIGSLTGLLILPYMLDSWGRRPGIVFGSLFMLLGIGLQSGATNFGMFIAARFILGFGNIIVVCTAPLLITEIAPVQDRAILVTIAGATYHSGAFIAAWTTYGTFKIQSDWSWRAPSLIQAIFTIFMLLVVWWIPESPRYYVARDQPEKALAILAKYHANGNAHDEVVQLEFAEITSALALERSFKVSFSFIDFLKTPGNRRRLYIIVAIGLFSQWSGNGLVSYYANIIYNQIGITDPDTQLVINGGLTTYSLVTNLFFCFFVDKWGRRPIFLASTVGMLVSFVIWTILSARLDIKPDGPNLAPGILTMIFLYYLFYNLKSGLLASYTTEILPYNMRAKGFTVMEWALYGSLMFNQYVNPIALEDLKWKYYIFYCCFLAFEFVVLYFIIVETRYVPLEEIIKCFDGHDIATVATEEVKKREEKGASASVAVDHVEGRV